VTRRIHFFVISLAATLVLGQRAAADSPFTVDAWSTADGLPQSSVIALTQTRDGYLWLGTANGLVRFDGNAFTPFNVNNTPGLPSDTVVFLFEDSRTNLWVGTANAGLCLIHNGVVNNFETGGAGGKIIYADEDETGAVWFCALDGRIFCWNHDRLDLLPSYPPVLWEQLFQRALHLRVPGKNGVVWHLPPQNTRVEQWSGDRPGKYSGANPWTSSLVPVPLKTSSGIVAAIPIDANVTAACEDREGNLVVGTADAGVYWFDGAGKWRHISTDEGIAKKWVLSFCFDREGNLWVGTDGGGLNRIKKNNFNPPAGLPGGVAKSAAEDLAGGLWVTFNAQGLVHSLTNTVLNYSIGTFSNAWSVLVDRQQHVWAGTRGEGLFRFTSGKFQPVMEAGKIGLQIFALFQGRDGKVWIGGENGLGSFGAQGWNYYSPADGLPPNAIRALAEDAAGNLWIGTDGGGLFTLREEKISVANAPVKDISYLLVDREGVLWAGTSAHGLARFQNGSWTGFTEDDGLINDIGYLIEDDLGDLWIGSYEGLLRVGKKSLQDFAADRSRKISCRTFLTRECSAGAQPAAIRTQDGRLWFPTTEGFVSVNPADLELNTNPPPVVIESVLVDGVQQKNNPLSSTWPGTVTLTPENEQLEIHFTALNFSAPKRAQLAVRFKYQLEGRDKKPTDAGGERVAHFSRLAHGKYVFRVTACNEDGYWNDTGATIAVTVLPPFWQTRPFVIATTLVFLGALAGIIYLISTAKLKRQLRIAQQKEMIEHERARIARDLHDQLGANLTQVTLLGEMAEVDKDLPGEVEQHAQQICATARETTRSLDEIVWAVNPSNDTLESLANYACKYAQDYFAMAGVSYRAELPTQLPPAPIPPEVRHNVFLAFKEAVNNVVKHAHATEARVRLQLEPEQFILSITDNGRGLGDLSEKQLRNGLKNMRRRLADVRGEFEITPGENGGTVVKLTVPIKNQ
jgi:signal transduction histidine kinase/ligand-binding sensor domain-containing protein